MNIPLQVRSGDLINVDFFIEVTNDEEAYAMVFRPQGGYWLSEYTVNDDYPSPWTRHIYSDPEMTEYHSRPCYCIFQVKEDANIYMINTYRDFIDLVMKYPLKAEDNIYIDFEKVAEDWDGMTYDCLCK